jgi:hypothetical protein
MKPTIKLATTPTLDGGEMTLYQHNRDFSINITDQEICMKSKNYKLGMLKVPVTDYVY